ncbi:hypothetical protein K7432_005467 [Basidiobolus ranarum]|uniref:Hyaluronan/mRNA-binding protein domain-containing protein n=1 Tax=Basidiobolus ranarum TaxID=34480 RepID=A0ABR2W354_9FUNG
MTRSRHHSSAAALQGERHFNRTGHQDPRGLPKKEGAGVFNWGRSTDEFEVIGDTDIDANAWEEFDNYPTKRRASADSKISTVDAELFASIHQH